MSISGRVITAVSTLLVVNTFDVGDFADADRYGASILGALGTIFDASDYTADPAGIWSPGPREVVFTAPPGDSFLGGSIRIVAHYTLPSAPIS